MQKCDNARASEFRSVHPCIRAFVHFFAHALMRYLVLTDIHANLEALGACLADATGRGYDRALVLGDLVGYGADPNAVIAYIQALNPVAIVRGNHDKVACGPEEGAGLQAVAQAAGPWTLPVLTPPHRAGPSSPPPAAAPGARPPRVA